MIGVGEKGKERLPTKMVSYGVIVQLTIAMVMLALFLLYEQPWFQTLSLSFVAIVLEALPFMLIGSVIGGFIEIFVSPAFMSKYLGSKNVKVAILLSASFGLLLPVCECAIVPVIRRFIRKGMPISVGVAYLLGGPIVNPIVALSTFVAYTFDWSIAFIRLGFGYLIAVMVAVFMEKVFPDNEGIVGDETHEDLVCCHHQGEDQGFIVKCSLALAHAAHDFFAIGRFLVIGAFVAALLQSTISRSVFMSVMHTPIIAILSMMILAVVSNLCSESDAFVAASFRATSMPLSAQMAFMVLGPMLDLKLIAMYFNLFKKRAIVVLSLMTFGMVMVGMIAFEWLYK